MSPENLTRALEIVAEVDPTFKPAAEVVNLDIDAQVINLHPTLKCHPFLFCY